MDKAFIDEIKAKGGAFMLRHPATRSILGMIYDAATETRGRQHPAVLNLCASHDQSGEREEIYRDLFTSAARYDVVDFWEDRYSYEGKPLADSHSLPFPDNTFDVLVTTKIIFEHVTDPRATLADMMRVVKPGGQLFLIFSFIRGIHQEPYDYFRFTKYAIEHLVKETGGELMYLKPTNTDYVTAVDLGTKYNVTGVVPRLQLILRKVLESLWLPIAHGLPMKDGARYPRHYIVRVRKP